MSERTTEQTKRDRRLMYVLGDVTTAFRICAGPKAEMVFDDVDISIKITLYQAPADPIPGQDWTIGRGKLNFYKLELDGKEIMSKLEMPRDVYSVIIGIGYGRGIIES